MILVLKQSCHLRRYLTETYFRAKDVFKTKLAYLITNRVLSFVCVCLCVCVCVCVCVHSSVLGKQKAASHAISSSPKTFISSLLQDRATHYVLLRP